MTAPLPPSSVPGTSPAGSNRVYNPGEIKWVAKAAGFPDKELNTAAAVAMAESRGRLNAYNDKGLDLSYGLWQVNMKDALGPERRRKFGISNNDQLFGAATNAKAAKIIFDEGGWRQWSTYKDGKYRAYIALTTLATPTNPDIVAAGDEGTSVIVGGKIPDLFKEAIAWVLAQLAPVLLRVGGFVGGGILVLVALILYVRGVKK